MSIPSHRKMKLNREEFKEFLSQLEDRMNSPIHEPQSWKLEYRCAIGPSNMRTPQMIFSSKQRNRRIPKAMFCDLLINDRIVFTMMHVAKERGHLGKIIEIRLINQLLQELLVCGIANGWTTHITMIDNETNAGRKTSRAPK